MSHMYLDVPATSIFLGQIIDHTKDFTETVPIKHPRNHMKTVMEPFKTKDTANPGRKLTKDTTDRDTHQDKCMNDLLTCTNKQIKLSTVYSRYHRTMASSSSSS